MGYALGCSSGLMVISQLVPFAKSAGIATASLSTMTLVVGACGNASGRILSGWMSDRLGRINVLRVMIAISMVAMPLLYAAGGQVVRPAAQRLRAAGEAVAEQHADRAAGVVEGFRAWKHW